MARISSNDEHQIVKYGDSSQLINWILDSGATCHMTPEVSGFIPVSLEDTDKCIEVADGLSFTCPGHVPDVSRTCPYCPGFWTKYCFHGDTGQAPKMLFTGQSRVPIKTVF